MIDYKPQRNLTDKEWVEIVTLEYVLTWGYSNDLDKDNSRYIELSVKKWGLDSV